ncbi:hypothetical protein K504DRAFT_249131 [Pleomassaria siparia CBS 279.74]|uniref:Uncharacterized protein n=1 Tax=Pleomassaria siparia CBS 279.74 TaxID=1314801 RepID=A0A6G1KBS5_9PLEO|nr:hypothetical protein K504DRAFT_249131 [Pleomassaria siparia CBS 279.74]
MTAYTHATPIPIPCLFPSSSLCIYPALGFLGLFFALYDFVIPCRLRSGSAFFPSVCVCEKVRVEIPLRLAGLVSLLRARGSSRVRELFVVPSIVDFVTGRGGESCMVLCILSFEVEGVDEED